MICQDTQSRIRVRSPLPVEQISKHADARVSSGGWGPHIDAAERQPAKEAIAPEELRELFEDTTAPAESLHGDDAVNNHCINQFTQNEQPAAPNLSRLFSTAKPAPGASPYPSAARATNPLYPSPATGGRGGKKPANLWGKPTLSKTGKSKTKMASEFRIKSARPSPAAGLHTPGPAAPHLAALTTPETANVAMEASHCPASDTPATTGGGDGATHSTTGGCTTRGSLPQFKTPGAGRAAWRLPRCSALEDEPAPTTPASNLSNLFATTSAAHHRCEQTEQQQQQQPAHSGEARNPYQQQQRRLQTPLQGSQGAMHGSAATPAAAKSAPACSDAAPQKSSNKSMQRPWPASGAGAFMMPCTSGKPQRSPLFPNPRTAKNAVGGGLYDTLRGASAEASGSGKKGPGRRQPGMTPPGSGAGRYKGEHLVLLLLLLAT